jgi:hypothetical protein
MVLLTDIYNGKRKLLAKKGDKVSLVADHDNVLIVEKDGNRFSVKRDNIFFGPDLLKEAN